ncbi:GntR family transcriptional regulator [Pukyongiella litopenaei]|uniref:GntR family transcriptional regulator n=1 Tax=Pukyongiella litopenaei TaxID=2605946 RepID=A0A2S0MQW3_9RHOB|nr:GntR family transcriptional regulator [Pukyongiella litopenaei]AVO38279.1 GntR family transcriptional regulator [Pukyongiella litopenaei]
MGEVRVDSGAEQDALSLSEIVYAKLRQSLMRAELKPHERLKVRNLAQQMGTSETPVREALFQLAHEGAIEIRPRYYIRVRRLTFAEYTEIRDIRLQLEPLAAERALPHIDDTVIDELAATHKALVAAEANGDWQTALQMNFDFHFGLYTRSGMPTLTEVLEGLWIRIGPLLSELYPNAHPTYSERHQHLNVLDALRARDAYTLREAIRMDLLEGGKNLRQHLMEYEKAAAVQAETRRR